MNEKQSGLNRRQILKYGAGGVLLGATAGLCTPAIAQSKYKFTYVVGSAMLPYLSYFNSLPMGAGLYEAEGLDPSFLALNGSTVAANSLISGQAKFHSGSAGLLPSVDAGAEITGFFCQTADNYYGLCVEESSPIRKIEDLKGKTIGISALGGGIFLYLKAVVNKLGWKEGQDITYLAVGSGLPALDALRRDRVQALFLWDEVFAVFESVGTKLHIMKPDPLPTLGFSGSSNVHNETIRKEPELVAKMARVLAKSVIYYGCADPDQIIANHYRYFPETRPTGTVTPQQVEATRAGIKGRASYMRLDKRVFSREEKLGDETDERIEAVVNLLADGDTLKNRYPASKFLNRQFLDYANDFDIAGEIEKAKAFKAKA